MFICPTGFVFWCNSNHFYPRCVLKYIQKKNKINKGLGKDSNIYFQKHATNIHKLNLENQSKVKQSKKWVRNSHKSFSGKPCYSPVALAVYTVIVPIIPISHSPLMFISPPLGVSDARHAHITWKIYFHTVECAGMLSHEIGQVKRLWGKCIANQESTAPTFLMDIWVMALIILQKNKGLAY